MSSSSQNQFKISNNEEEECLLAMQFTGSSVLPMVLRGAIELDLLEIMAKAKQGAQLSSSEIATHLPTQNPDHASIVIERMLRLLASFSILTCTLATDKDGRAQRLYGLAPVCKFLIRNEEGVSMAPMLLFLQDKVVMDCWYHLKDAVIEGGIPFNKAHGMHAFQYPSKDSRFNDVFNKAMYNHTSIFLKKILEIYKGFEGVKEVVDVGGGSGATLGIIVTKYPNIKGINFDLPHVIKDAPACLGVEHVEGDMFVSVPKGEVIFMKTILHDWSDDHCLKLLKNCWDALPKSGKVIAVESVLPEYPETDLISKNIFLPDMSMFCLNPGGKERTKIEFETLARSAGFEASKFICHVYPYWVIEFHKK